MGEVKKELIELSNEDFEALSSETRREILKILMDRQRTTTELSDVLSLSKSTVHEHLSKLKEADLVEKIDNKEKWKYYKLSDKSKGFLETEKEERKEIALKLFSIIVLLIGVFEFIYYIYQHYKPKYIDPVTREVVPEKSMSPDSRELLIQINPNPIHLIMGIVLIITALLMIYIKKQK